MVRKIFLLVFLSALSSLHCFSKNTGNETPDIKIVAQINKSGYVGEALTYEVRLVSSSPNIADVRITGQSDLPPDIKKIKGFTGNGKATKISEKGKDYYSWTIIRDFLLPSKEGKYKINGSNFVVFIPVEKIVYHDFWGPRRVVDYTELRVESNSVEFKVKKLPGKESEESFSGGIGEFNIEGWFPPGKITSGREAYVVFTISGYGNLNDLKLPNLSKLFGRGCRMREVEQSEQQSQRDGKLFSELTLTCRFVAEEDEFNINPLSLTFFNPNSGKYYVAESEPLHWTPVSKEKGKKAGNNDAIAI